jgi:AraC family transcriptional regulator
MLDKQVLTVSCTQSQDLLQILPRPSLRSSESLGWQDLCIQQHQQPAWETPEYAHTQHMLLVHSHDPTVRAERWFDGRKRQEQFGGGNNIVIVPATVEHRANWDRESPFLLVFLKPDRLTKVAYESVNNGSTKLRLRERVELIPQYAMSDPFIDRIGQTLTAELTENRFSSRLFVDSLTTALAIHLLRYYTNLQQPLGEVSGVLPQRKLQQAIAYIHDRLAEDLTITAIADELEMSQYYFSRSFKQAIGISPYRYVVEQRIEAAKQLLRTSQLPISTISERVGFASQNQLTIQFRNLTGTTPSDYRKHL